jgi:hypothetical protein
VVYRQSVRLGTKSFGWIAQKTYFLAVALLYDVAIAVDRIENPLPTIPLFVTLR